jgi:hypothetical protein
MTHNLFEVVELQRAPFRQRVLMLADVARGHRSRGLQDDDVTIQILGHRCTEGRPQEVPKVVGITPSYVGVATISSRSDAVKRLASDRADN